MVRIAGRELVDTFVPDDVNDPTPDDIEGYIFEKASITRTAVIIRLINLKARSIIHANFEVLPGFKARISRVILERLDGGYTIHGAPKRVFRALIEQNLEAFGGVVEGS